MSAALPLPPIEEQPAPAKKPRAIHTWVDSLKSLLTTITIAVFVITFITKQHDHFTNLRATNTSRVSLLFEHDLHAST